MGLFDMGQSKAAQPQVQQDPYEEKLKDLNAKMIRTVRQIGEKYIEENSKKDMTGTPYEALFNQYKTIQEQTEHTLKMQLAARGLRKCDSCGAQLPINSAFCNQCGAKLDVLETELVKTSKVCPSCGAKLDDDAAFCGSCGYRL